MGKQMRAQKAQEKFAGRDGELAAIKADLDNERASRKEGEANLAASRTNVAYEHRRGETADDKAGEMEER